MPNIFTNKKLYLNLLTIITLGLLLLGGTIYSLSSFTRHGEEIEVPDFTGFYLNEVKEDVQYSEYKFTITDSIFDNNAEKGSIIAQIPAAGEMVKKGRNIYLTVVAINPEMVTMPALLDLSLRSAQSKLETYGIEILKLSYVPNIAKDAVVEVKFNDEEIYAGDRLEKGSGVELVLGLGSQRELIKIPLLIGMTHNAAERELHLASLNIGEEHFEEGDDINTARIYRQTPNYSDKPIVKQGQKISLYYKSDENFDFDKLLETIKPSNHITDSLINHDNYEE
ncbi:MAG: hypothetical protein B6I18_02890 [Bacteroidetes bacterium 4572_112]|nr:MAG: hypothetical protein B6I18_02890 [Bacteroidetes bacterium 4572_112]